MLSFCDNLKRMNISYELEMGELLENLGVTYITKFYHYIVYYYYFLSINNK